MASRTVKSPAGETIEIVPDEVWAETAGVSVRSLRQWGEGMKPAVIQALWEHGEFTEKSGRTANEVRKYILKERPELEAIGQNNVMSMWSRPVNAPATTSKLNGKRTFSLKLIALPESWYKKVQAESAKKARKQKPAPTYVMDGGETHGPKNLPPQVDEPETDFSEADWEALLLDAPTVFESPPPVEMAIATQVAMALLTTCVEIISNGTADTTQLAGAKQVVDDLQHTQDLLARRLEENDKLRRQLREAADHINALKVERDGLRSRLRMTENNLSEILKGEKAQVVNAEIQKQLDRIMRQAPTSDKAD